jgi:hypothetical protein
MSSVGLFIRICFKVLNPIFLATIVKFFTKAQVSNWFVDNSFYFHRFAFIPQR